MTANLGPKSTVLAARDTLTWSLFTLHNSDLSDSAGIDRSG